MAASVTTRTQVPAEVNNFYDKNLLLRALPLFLHNRWGRVKSIPTKAGTGTVKFRRYSNLTAATTPLTEGVTPNGSQLSTTEVQVTYAQYGDYVTISDVLEWETPDDLMKNESLMDTSDLQGDQAADTLDQVTRDVLVAGTNLFLPSAYTNRNQITSSDVISTTLLDKIERNLLENNARPITEMINPTDKVNTTPIPACFVAIIHPRVYYVLKGLTGFTRVEKYSAQMGILPGEVGSYSMFRFVMSSNAKKFAGGGSGGVDVYATLILAREAYGTTEVAGHAMETIIHPLGSAGSADALNQRQTMGWKATFAALILNNAFMARLETYGS